MGRKTSEELVSARLALNTPDGFAISKPVIAEFIDEIVEQRTQIAELQEGIKQLVGNSLYTQVRQFHIKFGMPIAYTPKMIAEERLRFRLNLIMEEVLELMDACFDAPTTVLAQKQEWQELIKKLRVKLDIDLPEVVDALGDIDYLVEGTRAELGVHGGPIAAEIQRANMDKVPGVVGDRYGGAGAALIRPMKPPGWVGPDIPLRLRQQGWEP